VPSVALRPTREHVLPALVVLFPAEWFVLRSVGTAAVRDGSVPVGELVTGSVGSLSLASLVAVAVVSTTRASGLGRPSGPFAAVCRPDDRTLAVLAVVLVGAAGYFLAVLFVTPTGSPGAAFAAVGLAFGLPLVLAYAASVAAANVLGVSGLGTAAAVVGLAASAVWTVGVSAVVGRLLGRVGPVRVGDRDERED
jgi:hypothetical protein